MSIDFYFVHTKAEIKEFLSVLNKDYSKLGTHYKPLLEYLEDNLARLLILFPHIELAKEKYGLDTPLPYAKDFFKILLESPPRETKNLLQTYFILHFLGENRAWVKSLSHMRSLRAFTQDIYRKSLLSFRKGWIALVRSYLRVLSQFFSDTIYLPFALLNVGSLSDQDDVDLCIIYNEEDDKQMANKTIVQINQILHSSGLIPHHYLSETIGNQSFALNQHEFIKYFDDNRGDFVVISQALGSYFVAGDNYMYNLFEDEVLERFYFSDPTMNYYHENFLFSALSEINNLVKFKPQEGMINPKETGYRLIKALVTSIKSIFRIKNKSIYQTIYELSLIDNNHSEIYADLAQHLAFIDVLRMTYQVAVTEQTDIDITEEGNDILNWLAGVMGYIGKNKCEQLLNNYKKTIAELHKTSEKLVDNVIVNHLKGMNIGYTESFKQGWMPDSKYLFAFFNIKDEKAIQNLISELEDRGLALNTIKTAKQLSDLHKIGSRYLKGFCDELYARFPEHIEHLDDNDWFKKKIRQTLQEYTLSKRLDNKSELLQSFYYLEFVRLSMIKLGFINIIHFNRQFTRFYDLFALTLLELCHSATVKELHERFRDKNPPSLKDSILFLSTGGNGRGDSYNEDYDAVILVDDLSEKEENMFKSIVSKFSTFLFQVRTRLHNYFTEEIGTILIDFQQIKDLLENDTEQDFIYRSQLLDGHVIIGNKNYKYRFEEEIRKKYVFDRSRIFIEKMLKELYERRSYYENEPNNIKEAPGGLRDIVMVLHMLKSHLNVSESIPRIAIEKMLELDIPIKNELIDLEQNLIELKNIRDLYFLTVAQDNTLYFDYMEETEKIWQKVDPTGGPAKNNNKVNISIEAFYNSQRERGIKAMDKIIEYLTRKLEICQ
ncbi:MAG: hypothetical protein JXA60_09745 [Candidatus Coatesbacteria bacterium]|nr:hypothetical protein [Candidatus Coatesbacteria bacterium]